MDREIYSNTLAHRTIVIKLYQLKDFISSNTFHQFTTIPISPSRAESYINNPVALPSDAVLFLYLHNNDLISFRSVFAGEIRYNNKIIRFGWCSGAWSHPNYRRQGISTYLLKQALSAWNGKLLFTNYAPEAKKLILSTKKFFPIHKFDGARAYLFSKPSKLIKISINNKIIKTLLSFIDKCVYLTSIIWCGAYKKIHNLNSKTLQYKNLPYPDNETYKFIDKSINNSSSTNNSTFFKWIFEYPWISSKNAIIKNKYPFSSQDDNFQYHIIKIYKKNSETLSGIFIFSVREGHLKTIYFNLPVGTEHEIIHFFKLYCIKHKIEILTTNNPSIARYLLSKKSPFLHIKRYGQNIYSSFPIINENHINYQDCIGDYIFT